MNEPTEGGKAVIRCSSIRIFVVFYGFECFACTKHTPTHRGKKKVSEEGCERSYGRWEPKPIHLSWCSKPLSHLSSPLPILLKTLLDSE